MATPSVVSPDVLITIKLQLGTENRRFKLPLRDLGAATFPSKLRALLALPPNKRVVFERYSDSAGTFITLDSANASVYKQLYRAAKAKLKLRIKATVTDIEAPPMQAVRDALSATSFQLPPFDYVPPATHHSGEKSELRATVENAMRVSDAIPQEPPAEEFAQDAYAQYVRNCMAEQVRSLGIPVPPQVSPPQVEAPKVEMKAEEEVAPSPKSLGEEKLQRSSTLLSQQPNIKLRAADQDFPVATAAFTICCNGCNLTIFGAHWHCSICHNGDYDLCQSCVDNGVHCGEEDHYLIRRLIEGGKIIASTTETVHKKTVAPKAEQLPAYSAIETEPDTEPALTRTCNCCVSVFEENKFVTCKDCEDYDLCIPCHLSLKHGHNPTHEFAPVDEQATLESKATLLLKPGRYVNHHAICDGCNKYLYGVRNKCLRCPDWDYCNDCVKNAKTTHPGHGFVAVHEPLSIPRSREQVHHGIHCDGPLCAAKKNQYWIVGDRYKCTVCHDTDFCSRCEALPNHRHNRTHPLIKFRTPVRSVTVTTLGEKDNGEVMAQMGDRVPQTSSKATETKPAAAAVNAATQVQPVAEVKPAVKEEPVKVEKIIEEEPKSMPLKPTVEPKSEPSSPRTEKPILQAHFLCDATPDGSKIKMGSTFQQVWVMRNPGPHDWPAGCSVRYVGGDNMLNVDNKHPSSVGDIASATESNVINHPVAKDEEVAFWVTMKAPERVGKAISYWRLKSPDAIPFGHRLWCDIDVYPVEPKVEEVVAPKIVEEVKQEVPALAKEEKATESQMIFPKLDKESPVSSTYHEAVASNTASPPAAVSASEEQALLDDVESLAIEDVDSTDDGFLTDDDYEILDMEGEEEALISKK